MFSGCGNIGDSTLIKSKWLTKDGRSLHILAKIEISSNSHYMDHESSEIAQATIDVINGRLRNANIRGATFIPIANNELKIDIPYVEDPESARSLISKRRILNFQIVDESIGTVELQQLIGKARQDKNILKDISYETVEKINEALAPELPEECEIVFDRVRNSKAAETFDEIPLLVRKNDNIDNDIIKYARVSVRNHEPYVNLTLNDYGKKYFENITRNNIGKQLAIVLDGIVIMTPIIREAISDGNIQISFGYGGYEQNLNRAKIIATILRSEPLPANIKIINSKMRAAVGRPISSIFAQLFRLLQTR